METFTVFYKRPYDEESIERALNLANQPLRTTELDVALRWMNAGKEAEIPFGNLYVYVEREDPSLNQFLYAELFTYEILETVPESQFRKKLDEEYGEDISKAKWYPPTEEDIKYNRSKAIKAALELYTPGKKTNPYLVIAGKDKK